jgi:hypothetical protein
VREELFSLSNELIRSPRSDCKCGEAFQRHAGLSAPSPRSRCLLLLRKLFDAQGNQNLSGYMVVVMKLVDLLRVSRFYFSRSNILIFLPRYDGAAVVSRSIDLKQPIVFVSMNYR